MAQKPANQDEPTQRETALTIARAYIQAGKSEQARVLLQRLLARFPEDDAAWLLLLATNPPPVEEIVALRGMLEHHPTHRFRSALVQRLNGLLEEQRIVGIIVQPKPEPLLLPPRMRLGDYLVGEGLVSRRVVDKALAEQRRLAALGMDARLGTILLMNDSISVGQLGVALGAVSAFELGTFGEYLVQKRVLAPVEVASALAHQALYAATLNMQYLQQVRGVGKWLGGLWRSQESRPQYQRPPRLGEILVQLELLSAEEVQRHLQECYGDKQMMSNSTESL